MFMIDQTPYLETLLALRARFRGDITQMADNALNEDRSRTTSMPTHIAELASGNFDQELTLRLLGSERNHLDQIEAAIERIEEGRYGRCETCGSKIPEYRLQAIPYVAQCVQCASQQEGSPATCGLQRETPTPENRSRYSRKAR